MSVIRQVEESAADGIDGTGELYRLPASRWVTMMRDAGVLGLERRSQLSSSTLSVIFYHVRRVTVAERSRNGRGTVVCEVAGLGGACR